MGDGNTQLGGGDVRPPRTPATNTSADKLAELIDWTEGLRSADTQCSPSTQSLGLRDWTEGLTTAAVKQHVSRPIELPH